MNTTLAQVSCALTIFTTSACAAMTPSTAMKSENARRLENSIVVRLIVARMDRKLPYPRVLGDLDRTVESARERLLVDGETPDAVQDWLIGRSRQRLPGRQRVWKAEVSSLDELSFPEHMLRQPELDIALLADRPQAGRIVVMVLYRTPAQHIEVAQSDDVEATLVREVQRRYRRRSLPEFIYWE